MGETDGELPVGDDRPSEEPESTPAPQDTLQVPTQKRRRMVKSPTPGGFRDRSGTPIHGRSRTPFDLYLTRRSGTPTTYRSITPFLKREDKEKTPFELGTDIHTQLISNFAVFDKALYMDITEPEVPPVRYITSDMSVIDRAAVMDISNVEVIYVVEEYDDEELEEEEVVVVEVKPKKKGKGKKGARTPRRSLEKEGSTEDAASEDSFALDEGEREDSIDLDLDDQPVKKTKKKAAPKKKEKKEKSPSPKLSLNLELGGGQKVNRKMFDQQSQAPPARPPPKKSKLVLQMEEQAKAAAKAAEEEAKRMSDKPKGETFEQKQQRLKEEAEEQARIEEELRQQEEEEAAEAEGYDDDGGEEGGEEGEDGDEGGGTEYDDTGSKYDEDVDEEEEADEYVEPPVVRKKSDDSDEGFTRPSDKEAWQHIAEVEGQEFMLQMRRFSEAKHAQIKSEKERDADWKKHREQFKKPLFINFLTDRTAEVGHNIRLACAVYGTDLSVKWFKEGKQLERDAKHRIINNNNILIMELIEASMEDSGEYICKIANMNEEVSSSCIVTIYEVFKDEPSPPTFTLIKDFYHMHDDELTIECHVHGIPRPRVTWKMGVFDINPSYKFTLLEEAHGVYKLLIYRPSNKDAGKYTCRAVNSSGEAEISHTIEVARNRKYHVRGIFRAHDRIQRDKEGVAKRQMEEAIKSKEESDKRRAESVEPKSYRTAPEPLIAPKNKLKFATHLRDRMAIVGTTLKLFCNVMGPSPSCRWFKDDKQVVVGDNVRNLSDEGRAVLELRKVDSETSGVYKCVAKNEFNEIESSCYLKVYSDKVEGDEQEPMFALPLRDLYHSSENDLIIDTKVRGNPRPKIEWLKDNMPVVLDARIQQLEHLDGICELIINKPTPKDNGVYTCAATNKLGTQKAVHSVQVDPNLPSSRRSSASMSVAEEKEPVSRSRVESDSEGGEPRDQAGKPPKGKKQKTPEPEESQTYERRSRMPDVSPKNNLYFIAHTSNRFVCVGSKVKLTAVVGGPDATLKWTKDGQNVTYGPRIRNQNRDGLAVLEIQNAAEEDSGTYTITAKNEWVEVSSTALLHVYQPKVNTDVEPMFTRSFKESYHLNTNELILNSHVRGQPTPTVTWFKDSVELQHGIKYQIIDHPDGTCELIIDKPDNKDSGKYQIKAENRAGKADIVHTCLFEGKAHHIADNIHGVFHADPSLLKKEKKEEPVPDTVHATPAESGTETEDEEGKKGKKGKGKKKDDEPSDYESAPETGPYKEQKREKKIGIYFKAKLTDRVVAEGSKVKLACCVEGVEPTVKWFHDDEPVIFTPKSKLNFREGLCTLELISVTEAESGTYKCVAKDEKGEVTSTCKLTVYASPSSADVPPTFTRSIKDAYHGKVNELVLDVHVRGLPTPSITWVKDGVRVEPGEKYQMLYQDDGTCLLVISDPIPMDSGKYVCQSENREGKAEIVHMVQVAPKPPRHGSPPREKPAKVEETEEQKAEKEARKKKKQEEEEAAGGGGRREAPPPPDLRKKLYLRNTLVNRTVLKGSNCKWSVYIDGPEPTAKWFHDETPISFGPHTKLQMQDGLAVLNVVGVTEEDSGTYKLVVRGSENTVETTCNLFVYSLGKVELVAPVFTVGIKDTYYLNENELVLDCRVRGNPRPDISWSKGNDLIFNNEKYQQLDQADGYCKLIITNPVEKDSGAYSCVARNEVGVSEKIQHTVEFAGKDKIIFQKTHGFFHRDPNKPHFASPLSDHIVSEGGTVVISAELAPSSTPLDIQWFRDRVPLVGQANVKSFYDRNLYTLTVSKVQAEAEGTYTCRATNAFGRVETNANVHLATSISKSERPPLFLSRPENEMKIAVGDPFSFSFRLQGDPNPKLSLLKGLQDITKTDRVSKEASDDYIRFTVHNATHADSGTYFVVARNEFGTDRIFVTITVRERARSATPNLRYWSQPLDSVSAEPSYFKDPPGPITTEPLIADSGKNHISLQWGKPQKLNSAPVTAYRVDAWVIGKEGGAVWREIGMSPINAFDAFNLKPDTEYHFRVTAKNRYGWGPSVQTTHAISIGGADSLPEFIKILPGQMKALSGDECVLECTARGLPRPHIVWYKDGHRIMSNDRIEVRHVAFTCRLIINQVLDIDSGRYSCEATNCRGRVSTFARLQVVSDPKIYAADYKLKQIIRSESEIEDEVLPIFTMRLRDRRVQVTYPVRLTCQVVGYPRPEIVWSKDGNIIENVPNKRYFIFDDGQYNTLEISTTNLDDSGTYTATAKNELGSVSCHCQMIVDKGIRAYITPDFYMPLEEIYSFKEGQEIRLTTKVEAYPSVGVSWHRNGVKLRPSRKILATLDHNGFIELIIAEATVRDAGIYVCVASNAVGRVETSCKVVIEESAKGTNGFNSSIPSITSEDLPYSKEPMFVKKPRSSEAYEGDTVIIFCEVVGDPKPDVVWLRDFLKPEYYKDAPQFRRIGDGPEYRLEIPSAKLDFTGTYSIIAKNNYGEAKAIISLQIMAKDISKLNSKEKGSIKHGNVETLPIVIRRLKDLRCCDGDSITLECHVEAVPEPNIFWEKDGHILPSGKDFIMSYDGMKATFSIPRVYPEDQGEYTCLAKNNIGRAFSSACIIVDVPEEKENLLSRQLARPIDLLSPNSTPISTPRATPNRSFTPSRRLSYRNTSIDYSMARCSLAAPKFLALPESKVAEEGDTVRFQCVIYGNPMPWSTWDKDGVIVTPTTRITIQERNDIRYMEIEEVGFEDAGLYRITLENEYGRIEATARLDVICNNRSSRSKSLRAVSASPRRNFFFSRRIMGPSTGIGGRLALSTSFRGSSVPARKFYHNGMELFDSNRVHIITTDTETTLIVDDVTSSDEGIYSCVAQNETGLATSAVDITFFDFITSIPKNPLRITHDLPKEMRVPDGQTADLTFEIHSIEPYNYEWRRNGELLCNSKEFRYIDHCNGMLTLRILDTFDLDAGLYECVVHSGEDTCVSTCDLIVDADENNCDLEYRILEFLKEPLPAISSTDDYVSFCAKVYPSNAITTWTVCGHEIKCDSEEYALETHDDGIRILHILGVDYKHSGEVKITIQHPTKKTQLTSYTDLAVFPKISKEISLFDFDHTDSCQISDVPAYIIQGPKDCTALIGGNVTLDIIFGGYPTPTIKWLKAGRPITENKNITIKTTESQSILELTSITADDSGKYTVEIMNEYSNDLAVASVAVEGPPEPPSGKPSISQGSDRISIAWCGPSFDGGCMLTGFIIEIQEKDSEWKDVANVVDSLSFTIKNLSAGSIYRFRVRAENIHGRSEPSLPSDPVIFGQHQDLKKDYSNQSISIRSGGDFKSRFDVIEELGKGRFGTVYKVVEKESETVLAAKIIKCIKTRDRQKVQDEIAIMRALQHPKLLQLAATFENPKDIIMVMEYITGGELFERVVADDFTLTERDCILFLRQICEGVAYMHSQSVVHLDLKPENIMCHTRTSHQIKIIDFGLAQRLDNDTPLRVLFGTPEFIPPEIISYEPISFHSDMWSVGVICYVLLSGLSPFMGDSDVDTFANITRADYDFDDEAFDAVSQEAKDFISCLLVHKKEDRLSSKECLESKWLTQFYDENLSNNKICTDKLKKFIIRRKWQKTGNAIRALGRMANLSASRRNSAVSVGGGSYPNSPRPSISGGGIIFNSSHHHMQCLNEEEDNDFDRFDSNAATVEKKHLHIASMNSTLRNVRDKSQCSERSDSGFSECSNCSGVGNIQQCGHSHMQAYVATEKPKELSTILSHDILKVKLEEIAKSQQQLENISELDFTNLVIDECKDPVKSSLENFTIEIPLEHQIKTVLPPPVFSATKEQIMPSDFTNTVKMRKRSLENNLSREKPKGKVKAAVYMEQPGKVSMLKNRFNLAGRESAANTAVSTSSSLKSNICSGTEQAKVPKNVFDRLACNTKTPTTETKGFTSLPGSPLPIQRSSAIRLSGRVREATERLSQPKTIHQHRSKSSSISPITPKRPETPLSKNKNNDFLSSINRGNDSNKINNSQSIRN